MNGINIMTVKTILNRYLNISNLINIFDKSVAKAEEDVLFLRLTEEAYQDMENGNYIEVTEEEYRREMATW
jgi:hypothetical protein